MTSRIQAGSIALARIVLGTALALLVADLAPAATLAVKSGESIQAAISRAAPGDEITVEPGTYREMLFIDKDDIKLRGVIRDGARPVLDGENKLDNGIIAAADREACRCPDVHTGAERTVDLHGRLLRLPYL
jgi:nitrous oxidase accessory protein NosD